jgi:poly-gamma-glutamate synthesis protein (capsule biosynthesis protein)
MYESESGDIEIALTGESLITRSLRGFREPGFVAIADLLRAADVTFTDAEMLFHDYEATPCEESPGTHMRADPALAGDLKWLGIDIAACAMNHAFDYTSAGVHINKANLESRGIVTAGTGDSLSLARAPGYFDCPQGRVGLVSATDHINVPGGRAGDGRPGVHSRPGANVVGVQTIYTVNDSTFESLVAIDAELGFASDRERARNGRFPEGRWPEGEDDLYFGPHPGGHTLRFRRGESTGRTTRVDGGDWSANLGQIREARAIADWVIFSLHCGFNGASADDPPDHFVQMAHEAVDAGADIVVGHGTHRDKGIELYKGKPVFYGLGDFIMQNDTVRYLPDDAYRRYGLGPQASPSQFYERRSREGTVGQDVDPACWQTVVVTTSWRRKKLTEIRLHPVHLGMGLPVAQRGRPVAADEQASGEILDRLERCSRRFGTAIAREGGTGIVLPAQNLPVVGPAGDQRCWRRGISGEDGP